MLAHEALARTAGRGGQSGYRFRVEATVVTRAGVGIYSAGVSGVAAKA